MKIGETSGKAEWWMGPGSLTSERETKEARRTAGGTGFLLTVSLSWWTRIVHEGEQDPEGCS